MSTPSLPIPTESPGKFKLQSNGSFVSQTPRYINLGNGLVVTEDALNDRLDIVVPSVLGPGVITSTELASNAVTTAKILDGNVTTSKILDGNVTQAKLAQITDTSKLPVSVRHDWSTCKPGAMTLNTADGGEGIWNGILAYVGNFSIMSTTSTAIQASIYN